MTSSSSRVANSAAHHDQVYRITIAGTVSTSFHDAFPQLIATLTSADETMLEGVIADPAQLAGVISAICHRGTQVLHLEIADDFTTQ